MTPDDMIEFILEDEELSKNLLIRAVNEGKIEVIKKLADSLPSIDEKKRDDIIWAVIHVTISELTSEVFEMLIKNGPSTYYAPHNRIKCSAQHCAHIFIPHFVNLNLFNYCVAEKRNDLLRKLFEKYDIDPLEFEGNNYHNWGWRNAPCLFTILMDNNYEGAKLLIEHGADINKPCAPRALIKKRLLGENLPDVHGSDDEPHYPLCYQVLKHCPTENKGKITEFMLGFGADLNNSEMLRECCKDESIIKKVEDFYKEPKKRAKPDQD